MKQRAAPRPSFMSRPPKTNEPREIDAHGPYDTPSCVQRTNKRHHDMSARHSLGARLVSKSPGAPEIVRGYHL